MHQRSYLAFLKIEKGVFNTHVLFIIQLHGVIQDSISQREENEKEKKERKQQQHGLASTIRNCMDHQRPREHS